MHAALLLVALVVTIVTVAAIARRLDFPAPILMVAVGVLASYLPVVPEIRLTPEIVLVGLLPPLLYNAALSTSLVDFNTYRRPILGLSVGLIVFTTFGVGLLLHTIVPGLSWGAAFAIGAVVAPPDAVAATAVGRRIGMPRAVVTVLEGESLLNDATALVALNTAIVAATATISITEVGLDFLVAAVGGVACGLLVYLVVGKVRRHLTEPTLDTSVSIVTPFIAYVVAEEIHASGVLAVVVAGLALGHKAPLLQTPSSRIAERLNWRTFAFLLENAVFLLIGLQTSWIVGEVSKSPLSTTTIVTACVATLVAVIALRYLWLVPARLVLLKPDASGRKPPPAYTVIVGWAGMRGVVTLAAAFAIPVEVPGREVLLLIALFVTGGTLLIHGLTLPWVVRRLRVSPPDPRQDALARAELLQAASRAGLDRLEQEEDDDDLHQGVRQVLHARIEQREFAAWERLGAEQSEGETPSERYARLRGDMLAAERARVLELRSTGRIPHEVVEDVLSSLDIEESMIDYGVQRHREFVRKQERSDVVSRAVDACGHLTEAPDREPPGERACVDCVSEGSSWVHLRMCLTCGHVACCDSSPRRHAAAHFQAEDHPVIRSVEPGEAWRWCYADEVVG